MSRDIKTLLGFTIILIGFLLGIGATWWLLSKGDIVQILHDLKAMLPGWGWLALKVSLSVVVGVLLILLFIVAGVMVFGMEDKEGK
ncbi:MAG: hypothetical protein HY805_00430 [Nitrospirae bacterium]|nr:hypothetical protein [Nitrospirota bacterium]